MQTKLPEIAKICHDSGALLVVDTVASLAGTEFQTDAWDIDVVYSGSQKCLGVPPGIAPITFGKRAEEVLAKRKSKVTSWYFDLTLIRDYWNEKRVYHHTGPVNMTYALHEGLRLIQEEGLGKRSSVEDYRLQTRGGSGVITLKVTEKTGELVSLQVVKPDEELLIISKNGVIIRQRTDEIRETGRVAQGVKLIRLNDGDRVAAVAKILKEVDGDVLEDGEIDGNAAFAEANGIVSGAKSNNIRAKIAESNGDLNGAAHEDEDESDGD